MDGRADLHRVKKPIIWYQTNFMREESIATGWRTDSWVLNNNITDGESLSGLILSSGLPPPGGPPQLGKYFGFYIGGIILKKNLRYFF